MAHEGAWRCSEEHHAEVFASSPNWTTTGSMRYRARLNAGTGSAKSWYKTWPYLAQKYLSNLSSVLYIRLGNLRSQIQIIQDHVLDMFWTWFWFYCWYYYVLLIIHDNPVPTELGSQCWHRINNAPLPSSSIKAVVLILRPNNGLGSL
jgi:hypothetical protein